MSRSRFVFRTAAWTALAFVISAGIATTISNATVIETRYGGKFEIDPTTFRLYDIPNERFEELTGLPLSVQAPPVPLRQMKAKTPMAVGKVLALLIDWSNHPAELALPAAQYDQLFYSDGVWPTGSVNDYYQEVSYDAFSITGQSFGWFRMPGTYNGDYDIEDVIARADPTVNFADFDGDGDGFVDALWLIHAGPGQEETHNLNDIWSHAYPPGGAGVATNDGVRVNGWSMCPEIHWYGDMITIRVFCHEYGHILGMPDLYDYDAKLDTVTYFTPNDWNDHPMQDWDVMGYNGYNIMAFGNTDCPSHFSAWSRAFLGWTTPVIPACLQGAYELYNIEEYSTQSVFKVPISDDGSEYFLLEYRNTRSGAKFDHLDADYSAYCPSFEYGRNPLDSGLLITHIDENVYPNDGTPYWPNYGVAVVDAGYNPAHPWDGTEHTEWWYPYEFQIGALFSPDDPGQTSLTATTTPNSNGYDGPSGVSIIVTGQNPDYMTVIIDKEMAPELQPIPPVTVEVGDSINVGIVATDPNCTTPGLSPGGPLPPFVMMWDSSGGHGSLIIEPTAADLGTWIAKVKAVDGANEDSIAVQITVVPPACDCACHADAECDFFTTIVDVVTVVGRAFRNEAAINDASCPAHGTSVDGRTDVNCSNGTDIIDVVKMVDVTFRNADPATTFCDPCL